MGGILKIASLINPLQKEIVLLPYPFSDLENRKVRPAIIISNNPFNKKSHDCIAIPMTSVIKEIPFSVLVSQQDLSAGKLLKISRVRVDKIFSVEKRLILKKVGILNNQAFEKIKFVLDKIF